MSRKGHDYLHVVVDRFIKICILVPCRKQVISEQTTHMFLQMYGFILGFLLQSFQIRILISWEIFGPLSRHSWTLS